MGRVGLTEQEMDELVAPPAQDRTKPYVHPDNAEAVKRCLDAIVAIWKGAKVSIIVRHRTLPHGNFVVSNDTNLAEARAILKRAEESA